MTHRDITDLIEEFAPLALQLDWDNSGPQVGEFDTTTTGVLLTLDVTEESIQIALSKGLNLIISHHPSIFSGLKSVTGATTTERIVIEAIRHNIAIYACHTNIDAARGGVSWAMASGIGLQNVEPLSESGLGCIGDLPDKIRVEEFTILVKNRYSLASIKCSINPPQSIRRVAVMGGSGASEIERAITHGADALVTGDLKYHDFQRGAGRIALLDIGHYESEIEVINIFLQIIQKKYPTFVVQQQKMNFVTTK